MDALFYVIAASLVALAFALALLLLFGAHGSPPKNTDGYYARNQAQKAAHNEQLKREPYQMVSGGEEENLDGKKRPSRYNY